MIILLWSIFGNLKLAGSKYWVYKEFAFSRLHLSSTFTNIVLMNYYILREREREILHISIVKIFTHLT